MSRPPERTVRIREWEGLVSNRGAFPSKPGQAKEQVNFRCVSPGTLEVRGGIRPLGFDS